LKRAACQSAVSNWVAQHRAHLSGCA
jgi:hypothetical protein